MRNKNISFIGLASGIAGGHHGCSEGPTFLKEHMTFTELCLEWKAMITPERLYADKYEQMAFLNRQLAKETFSHAKENLFFVSIGGDHSCSMGTWSGVAEAKRPEGDIGLLWIDAHLCAHTPKTLGSGYFHELSLATLLGIGDERLTGILSTEPKVKPHNIVLIGSRSFTSVELAFLHERGVRIYFMEEIRERGLEVVLQEAIERVSRYTVGYGVSFDLDSLNPEYIQAVSCPVEGGLDPDEMLEVLDLFHRDPPLGFELVDYNPWFDQDRDTFSYIRDLFLSLLRSEKIANQNFEKVLC